MPSNLAVSLAVISAACGETVLSNDTDNLQTSEKQQATEASEVLATALV